MQAIAISSQRVSGFAPHRDSGKSRSARNRVWRGDQFFSAAWNDPAVRAIQIERPGVLRLVELPGAYAWTRPDPREGARMRRFAAPTCTYSTGRWRSRALRSSLAIRSSDGHRPGEETAVRSRSRVGARVGIPWLGWTCGHCRYCLSGRENLCDLARFTGRDIDGGFAELAIADERYCFALPENYSDLQVAPLLCAGLIGYRALQMTGEAQRLGLYGLGPPRTSSPRSHVSGPACIRVHARRGRGPDRPRPASSALSGPATRSGAPRGVGRGDHLRLCRRAVPTALRALAKGGIVVAPVSTCPTSRASPTTSCGASGPCARSPTYPPGCPRVLGLAPRVPVAPRFTPTRSRTPAVPWRICAPDASRAPR